MTTAINSDTSTAKATVPQPARPAVSSEGAERTFEEIISDYWHNPQRGTALDYLKSLSQSELKTIGAEHNFANPTPQLDNIGIEGSNNLLRHRQAGIDENGDGIFNVGEARTWHFPNSSTPPSVAKAWEEATEGMEEMEAMLLAGVLFMPTPQLHTDPLTGKTKVVSPGDPDYSPNPHLNSPSYYRDLTARKLASLDDPSNPPANLEFYRKSKDFYTKLLDSLDKNIEKRA